jgi:hypothetical protein
MSWELAVGLVSAVGAVLAWRAATITPIEEKETILHHRYSGESREIQGNNFEFRISDLKTYEDPQQEVSYPLKTYLRGEVQGVTQFVARFERDSYVPGLDEFEEHPWYPQRVKFMLPKVGRQKPTPVANVVVFSVEPWEVDEQLRFFCQMLEHLAEGRHTGDGEPIPEYPTVENHGLETHVAIS